MSRQGNRSHRRDERSYAAQNGAQASPPPDHASRRSNRDHTSTSRTSADNSNGHSSNPTYQAPPHSRDEHQWQQYNYAQHYHTVPRDWETINPEAYRSIQDPALISSPSASFPRYRDAHPANPHAGQGAGGQPGAPLNLSNLNQFNNTQRRTTNMAMWQDQSQRDGAYDGVGYVRSREQDDHWRRSNGN